MTNLIEILGQLIEHTSRLMLYLDITDLNEDLEHCYKTNDNLNVLIATKCGHTTEAIRYLLDATECNYYPGSSDDEDVNESVKALTIDMFNQSKAYFIDLLGMRPHGIVGSVPSAIGHSFSLIFNQNTWIILDSYYTQHKFTARKVGNIINLVKTINQLITEYTTDNWKQITQITQKQQTDERRKTGTSHITYEISECKYTTDKINTRFKTLVNKAIYRLNNEEIGMDDTYLWLLNEKLDQYAANQYLNSLLKLIK